MAKNPLIRSFPRSVSKPLPHKSAGILDDYAVRKVIATKEGSITRTPTDDIDIANKKYVDDEIVNNTWLLTTNQTGITGDKTGSFDLTTTGDINPENSVIGGGSLFSGSGGNAGGLTINGGVGEWMFALVNSAGNLSFACSNTDLKSRFYGAGGVNTPSITFWNSKSMGIGVQGGSSNPLLCFITAPTAEGTPTLKWSINKNGRLQAGTDGTGVFDLMTAGNIFAGGDLTFTGAGKGLPFGEIYVNDNTSVTSVSSAGFTQFLHFNTNGHSNNSSPDHTNDHITITKAGVYMVECCVNIKNDSGSAHNIETVLAKNNGTVIFQNLRRHRTLGTGSDIGAIPICGHIELATNDTLELWFTSDSASARNVIGEDVTLMVTQISG